MIALGTILFLLRWINNKRMPDAPNFAHLKSTTVEDKSFCTSSGCSSKAWDDETVSAARKILGENPEIAKKYIENPKDPRLKKSAVEPSTADHIGKFIISRFLGANWHLQRVQEAIERLGLYEKRVLFRGRHQFCSRDLWVLGPRISCTLLWLH